ncbi:MAG: cysteine--tRNA ligase [Acidobacteriota bacterium]|nr:cysteine--tRNA ligase [Acidobacteriota bacterium]
MNLSVTNTLTNRKEKFEPLEPQTIKMYACGITVYDVCHIGHAMQALIYDVMRDYFEYRGYKVTYVRNYTDVDDKIINRAAALGIDPLELSEKMIQEGMEDLASLDIRPGDIEPRVSDHIPEIIAIIEQLISNDAAYSAGGDVYYKVSANPDYGCLSNRSPDEMRAGARVEVNPNKQDPMDFALWKSAKGGEISWPSPWGAGRPGWHIECSALSMKYLGETFDLHGGGKDLIFPHHENEIAQSTLATGKPLARYWVHNGLVTMHGKKMSKSTGNFMSVRDAVARYYPETIRYTILSNHYSSNIDFTEQSFYNAYSRLIYFYNTLKKIDELGRQFPEAPQTIPPNVELPEVEARFQKAMDDDFNTTVAIANIGETFKWLNDFIAAKKPKLKQKMHALQTVAEPLRRCLAVLGLARRQPDEALADIQTYLVKEKNIDLAAVNQLIDERNAARTDKNWSQADALRDQLCEMGIIIMDTPKGTEWQVQP